MTAIQCKDSPEALPFGNRRGSWSVRVSGNWRVTFRFKGQDVMDVDYEDYH
ncbi:MAG: type II toxin-antitoxin system RelE/ParE family toxin [Nitrospirae bacterium]|nr:type II toxin-antitoxin system RelE/ParE family toxin [Nitrospirota bacterium]